MRTLGVVLLSAVLACSPVPNGTGAPPAIDSTTGNVGTVAGTFPQLRVRTLARGLSIPWDVQQLPGRRLLITERSGRVLLRDGATLRRVRFPSSLVWASGETGLMSIAVDPAFARNRRVYFCHGGTRSDGGHDVRVTAWRMNSTYTRLRKARTLLTGIPASSGRHGGCRLLIVRGGALLVGTGDAAVGTNPQDLRSLGGKVLRMNRFTGKAWPTNPWPNAASPRRRYILNYGHRNVQGLAQRSDGSLWSVEHGPDRDDEVNRIRKGGNYGWNPVPGYNETVPMTDFSLPGRQLGARWSSGYPTLATSGASFVPTSGWGRYSGTLAVAALKGSRVLFMRFDAAGAFRWSRAPVELQRFGRLRSVTTARNGDLLITTANGTDDRILRVSPIS